MAVRLICAGSFVKYVRATLKFSPKYNRVNTLSPLASQLEYSPYIQRIQCLHERVLDKDAGFDLQRNTMKADLLKDFHKNDFENEEQPRVSGRGRGTRSQSLRKAVPAIEEKIEPPPGKGEEIMEHNTNPKSETIEWNSDPNSFGNTNLNQLVQDEGDLEEEEYIKSAGRKGKKLKTKEYAHLIKEQLNARNLKEAINILEIKMLKEDRAKPENYIFNLLISGCAKQGYSRKAFKLFANMRKRGLKVKPSTYTSLFNACANGPTSEDGLGKATYLRELMIEKGYEPNVVNYNAMIKAFGRCGDVKTAYLLADEMMDKKLDITLETFNFLLQACASDKENGFRHCILTWHKILQKGFKPDYFTFLTVLRCVRDCGFGDLQTMQKVLEHIIQGDDKILYISDKATQQNQLNAGDESTCNVKSRIVIKANENNQTSIVESISNEKPLINAKPNTFINPFATDSNNSETENENDSKSLATNPFGSNKSLEITTESVELEVPNLLLPKPHLGSLVELLEVKLSHERFLLLGGLNGFLATMKEYQVTPDIETFTIMLETIPPTYAAEKQIIAWIRKIGLKADIDFFNILIKKRSMRFDYEGAKEVLSMIKTASLHPDIVTYGVLALGCQTVEEAREQLQRMKENEIRMNIQILGAMLRQGCAKTNFHYVNEIIQISLDERIKPNEYFLRHLHKFKLQCARAIDARHRSTKTEAFKKGHFKFCDKLRLFYEEYGIDGLKLDDAVKKIKGGPYDHYKEASVDGVEPLKNERQAKKTKLRKHIKKIKLQNLKDDPENTNISSESVKHIM